MLGEAGTELGCSAEAPLDSGEDTPLLTPSFTEEWFQGGHCEGWASFQAGSSEQPGRPNPTENKADLSAPA